MPRRKSKYLSDGSDSEDSCTQSEGSDAELNSQEDEDSRAERALFQHKRPKKNPVSGKDAAWEGIFGDEDDQETRPGLGGSRRKRKDVKPGSRYDLTKAPTFVTSAPKANNDEDKSKPHNVDYNIVINRDGDDHNDAEHNDSDDNGSAYTNDENQHTERSGSNKEGTTHQSGNDQPQKDLPNVDRARGGIGSISRNATHREDNIEVDEGEKSNERSGLGKVGLGFSKQKGSASNEQNTNNSSIPVTSFGRQLQNTTTLDHVNRQKFSSRSPTPSASAPAAHVLTPAERAHFNKISGDFGARFLAKLGWTAGKGLGVSESGRAVPIEVGKPMMGGGIREGIRTEDSKREARRMGQKLEADGEEDSRDKRLSKRLGDRTASKQQNEEGWKRQRKVKVRVEHKTYEQLIAEVGDTTQSGVGLVLDARSGELRQVQSVSEISSSSWSPTSDRTQLPELRHNLRLVFDMTKSEVDNLAREGKSVNERRRWSQREMDRARNTLTSTEEHIDRLGKVNLLLDSIQSSVEEELKKSDPSISPLAEPVDSLITLYKEEYLALSLDEAVVGAIGQVLRSVFTVWQPFDVSSDVLLSSLKLLSGAFNLPQRGKESNRTGDGVVRVMTPWESLLWNLWLPRVRSTFNNEWDPQNPLPAVHFLESWSPILPNSIRDNLIDQLILPKVFGAVERWNTRSNKTSNSHRSLAGIIFPWLPLLGDRVNGLLEEGKRRIRSLLRHWNVSDGVPSELTRWKQDVFSSSEWDKLIGEFVLSKLGTCLRDDLIINPRNQDMTPLKQHVLPWHTLIRPSTFARLLELEFFPKWLNILYLWLVHPGYNGDEVASWFEMWKNVFPESLLENKRIAHGFDSGLKLMSDALHLGANASTQLAKPNFSPLPADKGSLTSRAQQVSARPTVADAPEITFRSIVEECIASNELLLLPLGKSHIESGKPLFKVAQSFEGPGVTVYIGNEAVYAQSAEGPFRAVSLEDLVQRAKL